MHVLCQQSQLTCESAALLWSHPWTERKILNSDWWRVSKALFVRQVLGTRSRDRETFNTLCESVDIACCSTPAALRPWPDVLGSSHMTSARRRRGVKRHASVRSTLLLWIVDGLDGLVALALSVLKALPKFHSFFACQLLQHALQT